MSFLTLKENTIQFYFYNWRGEPFNPLSPHGRVPGEVPLQIMTSYDHIIANERPVYTVIDQW